MKQIVQSPQTQQFVVAYPTLRELGDEYVAVLKGKTKPAVRRMLQDFLEWADKRGIGHLNDFTRSTLMLYRSYLEDEKDFAVNTVHNHLSFLRSMFNYSVDVRQELTSADIPSFKKAVPAMELTDVKTLTEGELRILLNSADKLRQPLRAKAIMMLMFYSGLRREELASMFWEDVNFESGTIFIRKPKGGPKAHNQNVPLHPGVAKTLQDYRKSVPWANSDNLPIFMGNKGQPIVARTVNDIANRIVSHNHPSGDPSPSPEDVAVTRAIVDAGKLLDFECLDHIVTGNGHFVSLKQKGLGFRYKHQGDPEPTGSLNISFSSLWE